jgi:hypothetical protein
MRCIYENGGYCGICNKPIFNPKADYEQPESVECDRLCDDYIEWGDE